MVMVWTAITADLRSPLVFIDLDLAEYYRENILEATLKPWAGKQDSAGASPECLKNEFARTMATKISRCQSVQLLYLGYFGKQDWN